MENLKIDDEMIEAYERQRKFLFDLFCGMVCRVIYEKGYDKFLDCEPYEFASCLDMSFEDILNHDLDEWQSIIEADAVNFINSTNC